MFTSPVFVIGTCLLRTVLLHCQTSVLQAGAAAPGLQASSGN